MRINEMTPKEERHEQANGLADSENSFAWISDSKRDFNGFLDPALLQWIVDSYIFGPGFWPLHVIKIFLPGFWIHCNN